MSSNAIEIRGLQKAYPGFQLGPLDLSVPRGAIYGFIGPNGAGKSTTMDLMFSMGRRDGGTITVNGLDSLTDEVEFKRQVGYVSPDISFAIWGRVGKVIRFVRGFYPTWDDDYADRLLKEFRLNPADRLGTLSFGARTKLSLLLALAHRPKVLVLDEPTTGLDAVSRRQIFAELLQTVKDGDRTVFISSHGLADLERFADHVGLIKGGRLLFEGQTDEVVERFRQVDLEAPADIQITDIHGCTVIERDGNRWRALVDKTRDGLEQIQAAGAKVIASTPVSLEELFVALVREERG